MHRDRWLRGWRLMGIAGMRLREATLERRDIRCAVEWDIAAVVVWLFAVAGDSEAGRGFWIF